MNLSETDLIVDRVYRGSRKGNASDDPLPRLLGVDSGAGFRHLGQRPDIKTLKLLVLKSNFSDLDWPDTLDTETGLFTYYGDNKKIGEIHDTPRQGNLILRNLFNGAYNRNITDHFPVILLFGGTGEYRDVRFLGLAVPGSETIRPGEDLVAIWRASGPENQRFQNYKAIFTILDVPVVTREWINDVKERKAVSSPHAPNAWLAWLKTRQYSPLYAPHSIEIRNKGRQLPTTRQDQKILSTVYEKFRTNPFAFERCAIQLARLMMPNIGPCEPTRPWRDGGRDATGTYRIGTGASAIDVEFALEAKCYAENCSVGVKELSRLISRLKHRQFGILVTTSYLGSQAYKELKEDNHPVVVIAATDIVSLLKDRIGTKEAIKNWLNGFE